MDIVNAFDSTYVIHDGSGLRVVVLNSVVSIEGSRRPPRRLGALAGAALLLGAPGVASAADEEIQVYMDEIGPVGRLGLDVHLNWTPDGRGADVDYLGQAASDHVAGGGRALEPLQAAVGPIRRLGHGAAPSEAPCTAATLQRPRLTLRG